MSLVSGTYYVLHHPFIPSLDCVADTLDDLKKQVEDELRNALELYDPVGAERPPLPETLPPDEGYWNTYPHPLEITLKGVPISDLIRERNDPDDWTQDGRPQWEFAAYGSGDHVTVRVMDWAEVLNNPALAPNKGGNP